MKNGDTAWIKATYITDADYIRRHKVKVSTPAAEHRGEQPVYYVVDVAPDHPALPAVASWLSENPNGTERLWHVLDIYGNSRHAEGDAEQMLSSLIEALSHD